MGYYAMTLDEESKMYCAIVLPWGIYRYNMLPMGILVACDIFQAAMGALFQDLEKLFVYLDDLIVLGNGTFKEHMSEVDETLSRLLTKGLQINFAKYVWAVQEVDYLGFTLTRIGIQPQQKKVQAIVDLEPPRNHKKITRFFRNG